MSSVGRQSRRPVWRLFPGLGRGVCDGLPAPPGPAGHGAGAEACGGAARGGVRGLAGGSVTRVVWAGRFISEFRL